LMFLILKNNNMHNDDAVVVVGEWCEKNAAHVRVFSFLFWF